MKYIFFALLAANVAYVLYAINLPVAGEPAPRAPVYPTGVDTIFLLSENDEDAALARVVENPMVQDVTDAGLCPAVGPFETLFKGQAAADQLVALDFVADLRAIDQATGARDYRVMIPPSTSLQDAFRKLRELKSRDIDSYVITQGPDSLGISLGVFSTEGAAMNAQAEHERRGYPSVIVEIPQLVREFWIFIDSDVVGGPLWENLAADNAGLRQALMSCPPEES